MAVQGSTTGQLENASKEMISMARFTEEHNMPAVSLVEPFTLGKGMDTLVVPKVGQMSMLYLNETEENTNEQDIGMTTISVQGSIAGAKVILTDTLLRQNSQNLWKIVGRQMGDGMARFKDDAVTGLYGALNGGTDLGSAGRVLSSVNAINVVATAKADKYGNRLYVNHHPVTIMRLSRDLGVIGSGTVRPIPSGFSSNRLNNYWSGIKLSTVGFFEDGEISRDSSDDAIGVIADKGALGILMAVAMRRERERKPGIGEGAWMLHVTSNFAAFEIDDSKGAPITMDAANPATT